MPSRLDALSARVDALETQERARGWRDFVNSITPIAITALVVAGIVVLLGYAIRSCDDGDTRAHRERTASCVTLCESMGLRGGVVMPWTGRNPGYRDVVLEGYACLCGDGEGSEVRVDPEGTAARIDLRAGDAGQ